MKLNLNTDIPYCREHIGQNEIGCFSIKDIDSIMQNPVYAIGKYYEPFFLFMEWQKVFLFKMAITDREYPVDTLKDIYLGFLDFMEENICSVTEAQAILEEEVLFKVLQINIKNVRDTLKGKEEEGISKDFLLLMRSRYVYQYYISKQLEKWGLVDRPKVTHFQRQEFLYQMENAIEEKDSYQKGILWENVVEYYLKCIEGLKVRGHRVRTNNEEIDISLINCSDNEYLWEMGAYILVECKNWKSKVGVSVVRNISNIAKIKGNHTSFLFTVNGITRDAERQIQKEASIGNYVLAFDYNDLKKLKCNEECFQLLRCKYKELQ